MTADAPALARAHAVVDEVRDAGHAALDAALAIHRPGALVVVAVRAPLADPAALLAAPAARHDAAVWEPRDPAEWAIACAGAAALLRADGPDRFARIAADAAATWARVVRVGATGPGGDAPAPRFVGGFAYAPGAARGAWDGFGDARFVLPRWTYARRGDAAWLTAVIDDPRHPWHGELAELRAALATPPPVAAPAVIDVVEHDPEVWRRHVEEIRAAIAAGAVDKIVPTRTCTVELDAAADAATVLRRLGERQPACTRFAIRAAGRAFVGATPERLVAVAGREVATEALAGSIPRRGDDPGEIARLVGSAKERDEHGWVVRAIARALAPLCATLDVPDAPAVRTLRQIHHLHTPVRGTLAARRHVVELAAALHPTPAVGGAPQAAAMAWIAANEPEPRGWYASPVGWFDAAGDGELVVAIRSGLLDGRRALLYAGGGIVRDSDAATELDETRVKLRALLGALGAQEGA